MPIIRNFFKTFLSSLINYWISKIKICYELDQCETARLIWFRVCFHPVKGTTQYGKPRLPINSAAHSSSANRLDCFYFWKWQCKTFFKARGTMVFQLHSFQIKKPVFPHFSLHFLLSLYLHSYDIPYSSHLKNISWFALKNPVL